MLKWFGKLFNKENKMKRYFEYFEDAGVPDYSERPTAVWVWHAYKNGA